MVSKLQNIVNKAYYVCKRMSFRIQNGFAKCNHVVFVGDSITDFCDLDKYYPTLNAYNRGISADTTVGLSQRMNESVFDLSPSLVVLQIGVNDMHILSRTNDQIADTYNDILSAIRQRFPKLPIIVQSLYPLADTDKWKLNTPYGKQVTDMNERLRELARVHKCKYADVYPTLCDENGSFSLEYTGDGLHPNGVGYLKIRETLLPLIESCLNK